MTAPYSQPDGSVDWVVLLGYALIVLGALGGLITYLDIVGVW